MSDSRNQSAGDETAARLFDEKDEIIQRRLRRAASKGTIVPEQRHVPVPVALPECVLKSKT